MKATATKLTANLWQVTNTRGKVVALFAGHHAERHAKQYAERKQ